MGPQMGYRAAAQARNVATPLPRPLDAARGFCSSQRHVREEIVDALSRGHQVSKTSLHDAAFSVTHCGRINFKGRKTNLSHAFGGQNVGVTQVGERVWLVTFMQYDLRYFDDETCGLEPTENPFGPKVLPMCSE